jgi:hypothetical protein
MLVCGVECDCFLKTFARLGSLSDHAGRSHDWVQTSPARRNFSIPVDRHPRRELIPVMSLAEKDHNTLSRNKTGSISTATPGLDTFLNRRARAAYPK